MHRKVAQHFASIFKHSKSAFSRQHRSTMVTNAPIRHRGHYYKLALVVGSAGATTSALMLSYKVGQYLEFKETLPKYTDKYHSTHVKLSENIHEGDELKPENLLKTDPNDIVDDKFYTFGFATKQGFVEWYHESPLTHSSLVFEDTEKKEMKDEKRFIVIGRQSPVLRRGSSLSGGEWSVGSLARQIGTSMENEKNYELFEGSPIISHILPSVQLTGREVKLIINSTNEKICNAQLCSMFDSNCYTAAMYAVLETIIVIDADLNLADELKNKRIADVYAVFRVRSLDNYAQGSANNPVILDKLKEVSEKILVPRGIVRPAEKRQTKTFLERENLFHSQYKSTEHESKRTELHAPKSKK